MAKTKKQNNLLLQAALTALLVLLAFFVLQNKPKRITFDENAVLCGGAAKIECPTEGYICEHHESREYEGYVCTEN